MATKTATGNGAAKTEAAEARQPRRCGPRSDDTGGPLDLQHAAVITGVPYTSLRKLIDGGHLKHVQLGDSKRFWVKRADVERLIERSTTTQGG